MRNRFAVLVVVPVLALGVAACGSDDDPVASTPTTEQAAPAAPAAEGQDIVALASGNKDLSTLVKAVTAADLAETLQGEGPFTVFAPTGEAFGKVGDEALAPLLEPAGRDQLTKILTYHVVPGELKAADLKDGDKLETVNGAELPVTIDGDTVKVGGATVTAADVDASNGVVHVIDTVLMPPA